MSTFSTNMSRILRRLLSAQHMGYVLLTIAALLCIINYVRRNDYAEFVMRAGVGLGFQMIAVAPVLLAGLSALAAFVIFTLAYAIRKGGHPLPIIVLVVGGIVSETILLPLSPAEAVFYKYRSGYEAVIELARHHGLEHAGDCQYAFSIPDKYQYLTRNCVFVEYQRGLAVSFQPPTSGRTIAYAENTDALHTLIYCDGRHGSVYSQLEPEWFVCTPAQD